jgi:hypothetical protein
VHRQIAILDDPQRVFGVLVAEQTDTPRRTDRGFWRADCDPVPLFEKEGSGFPDRLEVYTRRKIAPSRSAPDRTSRSANSSRVASAARASASLSSNRAI